MATLNNFRFEYKGLVYDIDLNLNNYNDDANTEEDNDNEFVPINQEEGNELEQKVKPAIELILINRIMEYDKNGNKLDTEIKPAYDYSFVQDCLNSDDKLTIAIIEEYGKRYGK